MTLDAHRDRTALRLRLYDGGFTPLANKMKLCLVPGWSTIDVTPDLINSAEWARSRKFQDTGIRCGDVIAIDIDVDDKGLLNDLLDAMVEKGILPESPFIRIGMPPRELWVYRTSDKIGKRTTGHFMPSNPPEDHKGFAVEILGAGCQFAAYGQRDAVTEYRWPVKSLVDANYMELPEITKAQADAVKDFAIAFFESRGLERKSPAGGTDSGYTIAYDLQSDMIFDVHDLGEMTVIEIEEALKLSPPGEVLRCRVDALRPTTGSWAGMISLVDGRVCISDHGTYTSHFPEGGDIGAAVSKLGKLLAERFPQPAPEPTPDVPGAPPPDLDMDPKANFDDNLAIALKRYVYVDQDALVVDLHDGFVTHTTRAFRDSLGPFYTTKIGPKGGEIVVELAEMWRRDTARIKVTTMQMRPDQPRPFFREDGTLTLNLYHPPEHFNHGDAGPGFEMIRGLLPIESEYRYFLQWLSHKYQHPGTPGPAIMMVAHDSYGTGRGSLITMITRMFSERYVERIQFSTLTGRGSQSQYNEWLTGNVIVAVDEAQDTENSSRWQARNNAYEHLKGIIDPSARQIRVSRKTVKNIKAWTFASIIVMTNHADALVIPESDRRIAVLENGAPRSSSYWDGFHAWLNTPGNIGAFMAELLKVDLTGYNPHVAPPMTRAKADMIDAGASELDRAVKRVVAELPGSLLVKEQLILRLENYLVENATDFPDDWHKIVEPLFKRATRKMLGEDRIMISGRRYTVRMVREISPEVAASPAAMLLELEKNGPVIRPVRSGGVIDFATRKSL